MNNRSIFSAVLLLFVIIGVSSAIAPVKPGVPVPQIIIDQYRENPARFMPVPSLSHTMERYAAQAQAGMDDREDIYGYFPVVCGKYSDSGPDDWPISEMQTQLFDGPWPTGSMRDFYHEISFDQFHLDGDVYGWYTTSLTQSYVVGNNYGFGNDAHVGEFLIQLLNWTDPSVNFGQYDNDGPDNVPNSGDDDGFVDTIFFIHDGAGGETGANNIWSHSSSLQWAAGGYFYTDDPSANGGVIKIGSYIIQPSINSGGNIIEIGVFCHEFGHALGLPDLYDTDYSSEGIGVWGLMSGGSWNTPSKPSHMISWCRYKLGWITPTEINTYLHDQPITPIANTGEAYKLWTNGIYGQQYFMVENRQRIGFDVNLRGEGLCIWHVDETAQQSNEEHPKVDMEEADGLNNLYYAANSGDFGDVFPGSSNNRWFDEFSNPNSKNYWEQPTQVAVWNISDEADTMHANLDVIYSQPMLDFVEYEIDDSSGDDDGRADPGETIGLWLTVNNYWATANSVIGFLASTSPMVTIEDNTGVFGTIQSQTLGNNENSPFIVTVLPDAVSGEWVTFDVHFTAAGGFEQDFTFELMIGTAPILVVDDDLGENYETYITESLEEINAFYEVADMMTMTLSGSQMLEHDAIIWLTGDDYTNTLTIEDQNNLANYIDNGGTLILSGQNISEDIGGSTFFGNYLKCSTLNPTVGQLTLDGSSGNSLSEDMSVLLVGTTGAGNQTSPSSITPQGIAESLFEYPNGETGAINYYDQATGAHVAYFAFGIEAISGLGGTTTREELLTDVLDWGEAAVEVEPAPSYNLPDDFSILSIAPNPFNNSVSVNFQVPKRQHIRVGVYNLLGQEALVLADRAFRPGSHIIHFNGMDLASGVYLVNFRGESINVSRKVVLMK